MAEEVFACHEDEMQDGDARILDLSGAEVGLIRHAGEFFAYRNLCPHQGGPACEGMRMPRVVDVLDGQQRYLGQRFDEEEMHIVCPWHGYEYRLADGVNVADPRLRLRKFGVMRRDGKVYVHV